MNDPAILTRENHAFISYASEDKEAARYLAHWLSAAGLRIWIDQTRLRGGAPVVDEITLQIRNSRAFVLLLTEKSLLKSYVKHEVDVASHQQIKTPGFAILALRTRSDLDPSDRFPGLEKVSWMDLPDGKLNLDSALRLLLALTPPISIGKDTRHVFVSCGWGERDFDLTKRLCEPLIKRNVRLIGDATDQKHFGETGKLRVQRIMSGCTGHLMALPTRSSPGKSAAEAYRYFLAEWEISQKLRLARRTFCLSRAALPWQLQSEAIELDGTDQSTRTVEDELLALHDETEPSTPYVFLATDFRRTEDRNEAVRVLIEHTLGMVCLSGDPVTPDQLREAIVEKTIGANLVFADIACTFDSESKRLRPNLNTCIEAGIALGARRPLFITALDPESFDPNVTDKTTQVPFMFRNNQIQWYGDSVGFLAVVHRLALAMRRRILNDELNPIVVFDRSQTA